MSAEEIVDTGHPNEQPSLIIVFFDKQFCTFRGDEAARWWKYLADAVSIAEKHGHKMPHGGLKFTRSVTIDL